MNPIAETGPWSLGTLIWLPVALVLVVICLGLAAWLWWAGRVDDYGDRGFFWTMSGVAVAAALVFTGGTAAGMWPYDTEYHQWRPVSGEVEKVSKRLVASGESMSERYVVVIQGQPFGVDDTRASLLEVGDTISLSCKREWEYSATSGWGCRWASGEGQ